MEEAGSPTLSGSCSPTWPSSASCATWTYPRKPLGHAAEHDRVTITGDRQLVGLFVDDHPLVLVDRARLRGLVHPRFN
jgi:hypothetical protein